MTQEEKLEKAKELYPTANADQRYVLESLFPELKENEDERIRKEILNVFKQLGKNTTLCGRNYDYTKWIVWLEKQGEKHLENYDEAEKEKADFVGDGFIECHADFLDFKEGNTYWLEYIGDDMYNVRSDNLLGKTYHITPCQLYTIFKKQTWIEKQGEQKPFNYENANIQQKDFAPKQETKFHEGDWVVDNNGKVAIIYDLQKAGYVGHYTDGTDFICKYSNEYLYHLWTIADAKDGDALINKNYMGESPFIFKETKPSNIKIDVPNPLTVLGYCGIGGAGFTISSGWGDTSNCIYYPSTKKQCDTLFAKMKEAGYEWDAELKKVSKITTPADVGFEELGKAWAEEANKQNLANYAKTCKKSQRMISAEAKEALYDKPAWSEEDETGWTNTMIMIKEVASNHYTKDSIKLVIDWLKSIKQRIKGE